MKVRNLTGKETDIYNSWLEAESETVGEIKMEENIFAKLNERKMSEVKSGIDWLIKSYEENKHELEEYRAQTRNDTIIKEKNAQIAELEAKLHEYEVKEWDIVDFGFSEKELKEARSWTEEHYKNSGHRGGAAGGNFSYIIIPTGLGIIKEVKCSCGASHTIQDLM